MKPEQNPYAPPTNAEFLSAREQTRHNLRLALVILLLPVLYNYYCFDSVALAPNIRIGVNTSPAWFFRFVNIGGIGATAIATWFLSLPILEWCTRLLYRFLGRNCKLTEWNDELYSVLRPVVYFAVVGSVIWFAWTIGYYNLNIGYLKISIPVAIVSHLLAAAIYLRLVIRWYQVERIGSM